MNSSGNSPKVRPGHDSGCERHDAGAAGSRSPRHPPVAVAILAAGLSRRMGALNKLVQELDGEPMVRRVAQQALAARCDRVLVVLGHEADMVRAALSGLDVRFIHNPDYQEGLAASVCAAARAARPGEALMICLGDMPQVDAMVIDRLIDAYRADVNGDAARTSLQGKPPLGDHDQTGGASRGTAGLREESIEAHAPAHEGGAAPKAAYQPEFEGRRGNPVLWAPHAVPQLAALRGDEGARALLKRLAGQVAAVPVQGGGIFMDIDTPQALQAAREQEKFPRT